MRAEPFGLPSCLFLSSLQIGILKGSMETEGPGKTGEKTTTYSAPLCAVLYSKVFKQVSGPAGLWDWQESWVTWGRSQTSCVSRSKGSSGQVVGWCGLP